MKRNYSILLSILIMIFINSCTQKVHDKKNITVSILPQKQFVEMVAGDKFKINVMIPPNESPATYSPLPSQLIKLQNSFIYFRIGYIAFEKNWMNKVKSVNPKIIVCDLSKNISLLGGGHDKHSENVDPHIWLSPRNVEIMLNDICNKLIDLDPENLKFYKKNLKISLDKIKNLDLKIRNNLKSLDSRYFIVYHPAWTYFAQNYDLKQIPIEINGNSPTLENMKNIIDISQKRHINIIFVQKQFDTKKAAAIAKEIKGKVISIDPLAEDWMKNMILITDTFKASLTK